MTVAARHDPASRADQAHSRILALIESGEVAEGGRLPTENEFIARLGLSRSSIREALVRLRAEGRIVSRRGAGTWLTRPAPLELVRLAPIASPRELLEWQELRVALESEVVALAAERASEEDVAAMWEAQRLLVVRLAEGAYAEAQDAAFHRALAAGAHNPRLLDAVGALTAHIFAWIGMTRARAILTPAERREIVEAEHAAIVRAVAARRPDDARAALRRHLLNGRARMLGAVSGGAPG
jgi:DNA-binding FadR family transcriptional regulator